MLRSLLRRLMARNRPAAAPAAPTPAAGAVPDLGVQPGLARSLKLAAAHERAPMEQHLGILFAGVNAGNAGLQDLTEEAMRRSRTRFPPLKLLHRRYSAMALVRYFLAARSVPGQWAECGVFLGYSALACCLGARSVDATFDGRGLHLIDSFAGLSKPGAEDRYDGAAGESAPVMGAGHFATSMESVRAGFAAFPGVAFHQGWIPEVLRTLPESPWAFVHIDVDLYEPTLGALEYFFPRLSRGGIVVCDDYGSRVFPGAERAWDGFCTRHDIPFVELPTGQAVLIKA